MSERDLMGRAIAVVALSPHRSRFVPVSEASLYSLFPDVIRHGKRSTPRRRLALIKLSHDDTTSKLRGECQRWWDLRSLSEQHSNGERGTARTMHALTMLQHAVDKQQAAPLGEDLPIFVDSGSATIRAMDWNRLEADVVRGLNARLPFDYAVADRVGDRIARELPFVDVEEHFRSVVPDAEVTSLIRQLLGQHTRHVNGMSLVPLRWVAAVRSDDTVVVETGTPMLIPCANPLRAAVRVGALDVVLRRAWPSKTVGRECGRR